MSEKEEKDVEKKSKRPSYLARFEHILDLSFSVRHRDLFGLASLECPYCHQQALTFSDHQSLLCQACQKETDLKERLPEELEGLNEVQQGNLLIQKAAGLYYFYLYGHGQAKDPGAARMLQKAIELFSRKLEKEETADLYESLGQAYALESFIEFCLMQDWDKALKDSEKSLEMRKKAAQFEKSAQREYFLALAYSDLGQLRKKTAQRGVITNYKAALKALSSAEKKADENLYKRILFDKAKIHAALAEKYYYSDPKKEEKALEHYRKSFELAWWSGRHFKEEKEMLLTLLEGRLDLLAMLYGHSASMAEEQIVWGAELSDTLKEVIKSPDGDGIISLAASFRIFSNPLLYLKQRNLALELFREGMKLCQKLAEQSLNKSELKEVEKRLQEQQKYFDSAAESRFSFISCHMEEQQELQQLLDNWTVWKKEQIEQKAKNLPKEIQSFKQEKSQWEKAIENLGEQEFVEAFAALLESDSSPYFLEQGEVLFLFGFGWYILSKVFAFFEEKEKRRDALLCALFYFLQLTSQHLKSKKHALVIETTMDLFEDLAQCETALHRKEAALLYLKEKAKWQEKLKTLIPERFITEYRDQTARQIKTLLNQLETIPIQAGR